MLVELSGCGDRVLATPFYFGETPRGRAVLAPASVIRDALALLPSLLGALAELKRLERQKLHPKGGPRVCLGLVVCERCPDGGLTNAAPVSDREDSGTTWVPRILRNLDNEAMRSSAPK